MDFFFIQSRAHFQRDFLHSKSDRKSEKISPFNNDRKSTVFITSTNRKVTFVDESFAPG